MKAFDVFIKTVREFNVILRDMSFIDSLVLRIKVGGRNIYANMVESLFLRTKISYKSKVIIAEWLDKINPRPVIKSKTHMTSSISSDEYFSDTNISSLDSIRTSISNRESVSASVKSKLSIILDPTVGKFRKLVEFDNLILAELDNLTLEEMDYIFEVTNDVMSSIR